MAVGGVTAVAAGVYTTREGARVMWGYINRILGQPSLIRESSIGKYPLLGPLSRAYNKGLKIISGSGKTESKTKFGKYCSPPFFTVENRATCWSYCKYQGSSGHFLTCYTMGLPGTGKTMVAKEIAEIDYAMMTGGDVAPLGAEAVTKIHQIFDWAKKSKEGLLLFIDEADAFLCERNSIHMSEAQRSALNALLFRTGDQSRDVALVLATNRPGDLDSAVTDRIDEVIEFPLPGAEERAKLLTLYLEKYLSEKDDPKSWWRPFKGKKSKKIVKDLPREVICVAARKTEGFSGREIAKLVASVQASVYGTHDCVLDSHLFMEIVNFKVAEHQQRIKIAAAGGVVKPRS
ncbi:hypothetical protein IFM89_034089 [Coptis chinensis]|uniref:AAA+ ATPase domain-containing protein n=1 Tax=Coptis chinensis TaxID=261450 RepID=A0A835LFX6_9MAGN|nr:hypothetical protein IFM89_034089 [Coptis chinensis]